MERIIRGCDPCNVARCKVHTTDRQSHPKTPRVPSTTIYRKLDYRAQNGLLGANNRIMPTVNAVEVDHIPINTVVIEVTEEIHG